MRQNNVPFDELLLSRARLSLLSALLSGDEIEFTVLRNMLGLSDGNLSVQIRKLEEAGYLKVKKVFVERRPKTFCKITEKGRQALESFTNYLNSLVHEK
ncbi:MAG: transcriptional regulator [Anaerohalosphaeraceae bacterium]